MIAENDTIKKYLWWLITVKVICHNYYDLNNLQ
jgi:hypothetical protein